MTGLRYTVVASPLHDAAAIDRITSPVRAALDGLGGAPTDDPTAQPASPHVVVMATGGTERAALDVVARRHLVVPWEPVVLVAHGVHNSLPAALETLASLRQSGVHGRIVPADTDPELLAAAVEDLRSLHRLRGSRLGLVGEPSEWLVASVPMRERLLDRWGIELVDVDIEEPIRRHRATDPDDARPVAIRFAGHGSPDDETVTAAALHPALVATLAEHQVDAVAVRCFDFITDLATSGCVALAELNDTGVVAGCEGDVASTVSMMIARELLEQPAWVANPAQVDGDANTVLLAHCTVAPSMVHDLELHTHFESGLGIGLRGTFEPGWVTLMRLGGAALERHWFTNAEIVETGSSPDLCRTQVTVRLADQPASSLLEDPLGNHVVMVLGRHRDRLERWWQLAFGPN